MIQPTGHLVLVKLRQTEEITAGGLYVPETVRDIEQKASTVGVILAVGPQAWKEFGDGEPWAEVGDEVVFPRYSGIAVDERLVGKKNCVLMNDDDIKGTIKGE